MKKKEIYSDIVWIIGVIIVIVLIRTFIFTPVKVSGGSMDPTMQDKERVIALRQGAINRFDIVTFPAPAEPKKSYIKRVIGLPGDEIAFKDDELYVNGKKTKEPYLDAYKKQLENGDVLTFYIDMERNERTADFSLETMYGTTKVPKGHLFVMGDNRQISKDSRFAEVGFIEKKAITGNVKFCYWPPKKVGSVK